MSALTYRNGWGELVDIPAVPDTKAKKDFAATLQEAIQCGAVAITGRHATKAVLLSFDEFESLVHARSRMLDDLGAEFDGLVARLQTPAARKGMEAAFHASPAKLGRAAAKAARRGRRDRKSSRRSRIR